MKAEIEGGMKSGEVILMVDGVMMYCSKIW